MMLYIMKPDSVLIRCVRQVQPDIQETAYNLSVQEFREITTKSKNYWDHLIQPKSGRKRPLHKRLQ